MTTDAQSLIAQYQAEVEQGTATAATYRNLGWSYHALGEEEKALEAFRQAAALDAYDPMAFYGLGVIYQIVGQARSAQEAFHQAARLVNRLPDERQRTIIQQMIKSKLATLTES